jgi:hypothetical protein
MTMTRAMTARGGEWMGIGGIDRIRYNRAMVSVRAGRVDDRVGDHHGVRR